MVGSQVTRAFYCTLRYEEIASDTYMRVRRDGMRTGSAVGGLPRTEITVEVLCVESTEITESTMRT